MAAGTVSVNGMDYCLSVSEQGSQVIWKGNIYNRQKQYFQ